MRIRIDHAGIITYYFCLFIINVKRLVLITLKRKSKITNVHRRSANTCSQNFLQYSQENICVGVSL